jgi:hypothetical protein
LGWDREDLSWSADALGHEHSERQAVLDFEHLDGHGAKLSEVPEQIDDLTFEQEVAGGEFGPRPVIAAELELADDAGRRVEDGLTVTDWKMFDAAEVE